MSALKKLIIKDQIAPPNKVLVNGEEAHTVKDQNDNILWAKHSINLEDDEGDLYDINNLDFETDGYWSDLDSFLWNCLDDYCLTISAEDSTALTSEADSSFWAATGVPANRDLAYIETSADADYPSASDPNSYESICAYEGETLFASGTLNSGFYNLNNASEDSWGDLSFKQELSKNDQGNYVIPTYSSTYSIVPKWCYLELTKPSNSTFKRTSSWAGSSGTINDGDKVYYKDILRISSASDTPKGYYPAAGITNLEVGDGIKFFTNPEEYSSLDITPRPPLYLISKPVWRAIDLPTNKETSGTPYIYSNAQGATYGMRLEEVNLGVNPFFEDDPNGIQNLDIPFYLYSDHLDLVVGSDRLTDLNEIKISNFKGNNSPLSYAGNLFFKGTSYVDIYRPHYYEVYDSTPANCCTKCFNKHTGTIYNTYCRGCGEYNTVKPLDYPELFDGGKTHYCTNSDCSYHYGAPASSFAFNYYRCSTCGEYHYDNYYPIRKNCTLVTRNPQQLPTYCYLTYVYDNNLFKVNLLPSSSETVEDCTLKIDPVVTVDNTTAEVESQWVDTYRAASDGGGLYSSSYRLKVTLPSITISAPLDYHSCTYSYSVRATPLDEDSNVVNELKQIAFSNYENFNTSNLSNGFTIHPSVVVSNDVNGTSDEAKVNKLVYDNSKLAYLEIEVYIKFTIDGVEFVRAQLFSFEDADITRESVQEQTDGNGTII